MKKNLAALGKCLMAFAGILAILGMFSFVSCSGDDDDESGSTSKTEQKSDEKKGDEQKESSDTPSVDPSNPPSGGPSGSVEITFMANDGTETQKSLHSKRVIIFQKRRFLARNMWTSIVPVNMTETATASRDGARQRAQLRMIV